MKGVTFNLTPEDLLPLKEREMRPLEVSNGGVVLLFVLALAVTIFLRLSPTSSQDEWPMALLKAPVLWGTVLFLVWRFGPRVAFPKRRLDRFRDSVPDSIWGEQTVFADAGGIRRTGPDPRMHAEWTWSSVQRIEETDTCVLVVFGREVTLVPARAFRTAREFAKYVAELRELRAAAMKGERTS